MGRQLNIGTQAPAFEGTDQHGETFRSADLLGHKNLVVFFYPGDFTPVCTKQACGMRDAMQDLPGDGVEVVGVSADNADKHRRFAEQYKLPFRLLADTDGSIRRAFGVRRFLGVLPGRETYVIDKEGIVRAIHTSATGANSHVSAVKNALQTLE